MIEPGMATTHATLQATPGEDVGGSDLPSQLHRVFRGQDVQGGAEANVVGMLGGGAEERQGVGRDTKLLGEVMVNSGVDIEAHLLRMLDLAQCLPVELCMRLLGRTLHFCIHAKTHRVSSFLRRFLNASLLVSTADRVNGSCLLCWAVV